MNHQHLAIGQEVIFVGPDKQNHKATITQVYNADEAAVAWPNGNAIARFSEEKKENTFHFEQASPKAEHKK